MAKQRYTVRGEGEYETRRTIYAETAEDAAMEFGEKYITDERSLRSEVHVLVITPSKQRLLFGVSRVSYIEATPLDDEDEKFPVTSMRSEERYLKVKCPHCGAKPGEPCRTPSGKKAPSTHKRRISASIVHLDKTDSAA